MGSNLALDSWQIATILLGGAATLCIFSFLIKENPFYRFFEHLFIGIASGFGITAVLKNFLWPKFIMPMFGWDIVTYPDGTTSGNWDARILLYLIPMAFGLLYYFIYSRRYLWLAKLVIGFTLGCSGGLAFKGFFNEMIPQFDSSFRSLVVFNNSGVDWAESIANTVFVVTLLSVMFYFFFSVKHESRSSRAVSNTGRYLMMVCFGAFFGSTVMARMALLVERLNFLFQDCWKALSYLFV